MRILLIDDEPPARERLATLLEAHPQVEVIGAAGQVAEALALCRTLQPDALFLDIEMGRHNGFWLLEQLPLPRPAVVFVTAHEQFAVPAFEVAAIDYLLKPVHPERLAVCLTRLAASVGAQFSGGEEVVVTQWDGSFNVVALEAITHIQADENYTRLFTREGKMLYVRRGIQAWEAMLAPERFARVHRSLLVNLNAVAQVRSLSRDEGELTLHGHPAPLPLARRALQRLRRLMENRG